MRIKINKKSATINLTTQKEVEAFADLINHYMDVSYEGDDGLEGSTPDQDEIALKLDMKLNKEKY